MAKNMHLMNSLAAILNKSVKIVDFGLILFGVIKHNKKPGTKIGLYGKCQGPSQILLA
jgi:hypothetical protein